MEEVQLDYATLVSVYQAKVADLTQQTIILEAKNIILSKKIQELVDNSTKQSSTKKRIADKPEEENTY